MEANKRQVGGSHYGGGEFQHWDMVVQHDLDYFQGQITKYVMRWKAKNGLQDLEKAQHFLEKYIEEIKAGRIDTPKSGLRIGGGIPVADNGKFQAGRSDQMGTPPPEFTDHDARALGLFVEGWYGDGTQEYSTMELPKRRVRARTPQEARALLAATWAQGGS